MTAQPYEFGRGADPDHQWYFLLRIWADEMRGKDRSLKGKRTTRGFTLIELIIVTVIVAILAAIAIPVFGSYRVKAQIAVAISAVRVIEQTVTSYFIAKGDYPASLAEVGLGTLKDPWGEPYQYFKIYGLGKKATGGARKDRFMVPINTDFDLCSMGPDRKTAGPLTAKASQDDIIRAHDGGYVGTAARY
jgi:general secretion pathway protein G